MEIDNPMLETPDFSLLEHQMPHFNRILSILFKSNGYIDTSTMGCGKTFVTTMVASILGLKIVVFCPKTVKVVWKKVCRLAGVDIVDLITYQSSSSKLRKQPKHGYLHKTAHLKGKGANKREHYYFSSTEKYHELLASGILLVVDEIQFTRNNTAQYRAVRTLVKTIATSSSSPSKFALLSATPFDKPSQAINLMKMVGVITQEELFFRSRPTGWRELLIYCKDKDIHTTSNILLDKSGLQRRDYDQCAFDLYSKVVRKELCSAMPLVIDAECDAKNGYYNLEEKDIPKFMEAILLFENAASHSKDPTKPRTKEDSNYAELTIAMVALEKCKIPIFERITRRYLEENPYVKVVVGVHYYEVLRELERRLAEYRPLILCGEIDDEYEREEIVDRFNNDNDYRLMLCISKVGGVGISLHDTTGDYPRVLLLSPDFNLIDTHQATGRVYRVGTKSKTTIRLIYANAKDNDERSIHRILANKSETLRAILEEYTRNDVLLPIDYQEERET